MTSVTFTRFPAAVLCAIFASFCGDEPVYIPFHETDKRYVLGRVCSSWWNIICAMRALWTNIFFTAPLPPYPSPNTIFAQFIVRFARSGNELLTISFEKGCYDWPFSIAHSIVLPNSRRIKKLMCPIISRNDIASFLMHPASQFPVLESIELCCVDTWDRNMPIFRFPTAVCFRFNVFRAAPRLRSLTVHLRSGLDPIDLHLPWSRLTSINVGSVGMRLEHFVEILRSGSLQLQNGFFCVELARLSHVVLPIGKITMHRLQNLRLRLMFPSNDIRLFSALQLPALTYFWVEMYDQYQEWDISLYTTLLRSSTNLQQLKFSDLDDAQPPFDIIRRRHRETSYHALEQLFKFIPNVVSLYLPLGTYLHPPTVEKMMTCTLLPRLCILQVGSTSDSMWHILSMIRRRCEFIRRLDSDIQLGLSGSSIPRLCSPDIKTQPQPKTINSLFLRIPRQHYTKEEQAELNQQAQILTSLGIMIHVYTTPDLPLPLCRRQLGSSSFAV